MHSQINVDNKRIKLMDFKKGRKKAKRIRQERTLLFVYGGVSVRNLGELIDNCIIQEKCEKYIVVL